MYGGGCRSGAFTGTSLDRARCHVVRLDLGWNGLDGALPWDNASLDSLRHLVVLDLASDPDDATALRGRLPAVGLGALTDLQSLRLDSNRLSGGLPSDLAEIAALGVLTTLDLRGRMVKVAVLARPWLATSSSSGCI